MFATFILVLFYRYDRITASPWIRYPGILLGETTIGICKLADYSMAKKRQHLATVRASSGGAPAHPRPRAASLGLLNLLLGFNCGDQWRIDLA
jgi:hypothetical protein